MRRSRRSDTGATRVIAATIGIGRLTAAGDHVDVAGARDASSRFTDGHDVRSDRRRRQVDELLAMAPAVPRCADVRRRRRGVEDDARSRRSPGMATSPSMPSAVVGTPSAPRARQAVGCRDRSRPGAHLAAPSTRRSTLIIRSVPMLPEPMMATATLSEATVLRTSQTTWPRPPISASKRSPAATGTIGPSAPVRTTSPARSGAPSAEPSVPPARAPRFSGSSEAGRAGPRRHDFVPSAVIVMHGVAQVETVESSSPVRPARSRPQDALSAIVSAMRDVPVARCGCRRSPARATTCADGATRRRRRSAAPCRGRTPSTSAISASIRRLHQPGPRIGLPDIAHHHVGEQDAEVRLVDTELALHRQRGQADLAPDDAPPGRQRALGADVLNRIGGVEIIGTDQIPDRVAGLLSLDGLRQPVGRRDPDRIVGRCLNVANHVHVRPGPSQRQNQHPIISSVNYNLEIFYNCRLSGH